MKSSLATLISASAQGIITTVLPLFFLIGAFSGSMPLTSLYAMIIGMAAIGSFFKMYRNYKVAKDAVKNLMFAPTGNHKELFESMLRQAGMNTSSVNVRYAWSNHMIAITQFDTISIDPYFWSLIDEDPEAQKSASVLKTYIEPTLTPETITRLAACKAACSLDAQKFLFKHEVAHSKNNASIKQLAVLGLVLTLINALSWIVGVHVLLRFGLIFAIPAMIVVGTFLDLFLSFGLLNYWKYREEKRADAMACQWGSQEEIVAAAEFFKKLNEIVTIHDERIGIIRYIPVTFFSGHPANKERSERLLAYARKLNPAVR